MFKTITFNSIDTTQMKLYLKQATVYIRKKERLFKINFTPKTKGSFIKRNMFLKAYLVSCVTLP